MRVSNKCARYSSLGITTDYAIPILRAILDKQIKDGNYYILPQLTFDGINERR